MALYTLSVCRVVWTLRGPCVCAGRRTCCSGGGVGIGSCSGGITIHIRIIILYNFTYQLCTAHFTILLLLYYLRELQSYYYYYYQVDRYIMSYCGVPLRTATYAFRATSFDGAIFGRNIAVAECCFSRQSSTRVIAATSIV